MWQYSLVSPLGLTQYPLKQILNIYIYLFTEQEEEQIAYHGIASCLYLLQEKNYAVTIYSN